MTCIIGLKHGDHIYMGSDSAAVSGYDIELISVPKVFKSQTMIMGYTSSFRMGQLLQYELTLEPQSKAMSDYAYMVTVVAETIREMFKAKGFLWVENDRQSGGAFLVGYRKELYSFQGDFSVLQYQTPYTAIGCGAPYALGAMEALSLEKPKTRIEKALEIAAMFSTGVSGPFYTVKL